nr:NAD(P)-dependent oxidoreductase [uncultured Sellimonas sp.]
MNKIVVTGASGFLGSNLIKKLVKDNKYYIYALSSHADELYDRYQDMRIVFINKDIINNDEMCNSIMNESIIINCAFPRNSTGTEIAIGLDYIQKLFFNAKKFSAKAIINISSQSVYSGNRKEAATEETIVCLDNTYAVGKYAVELLSRSIFDKSGIPYVNVRLASLIGPGFNQRIVNRFVKQALALKPITIYKSMQKFGFLDIEDAVNGILSLLDINCSQWKRVYNLGNGKGYTIEEIINCVEKVFKSLDYPFPQINIGEGQGEGNTSVDFKSLCKDTGYTPTVDLCTSILKIVEDLNINA